MLFMSLELPVFFNPYKLHETDLSIVRRNIALYLNNPFKKRPQIGLHYAPINEGISVIKQNYKLLVCDN